MRFWSMVSIVLLHCGSRFTAYQDLSLTENILLVQAFKFGTIAFFIISGFLVGDRLPASDPLGYLRRRANRLVPAWALWYAGWIVCTAQADLRHSHAAGLSLSAGLIASTVCKASIHRVFDTPLWFVPNFLVALTCVVMLRRWLNDLRLGAVLLAVNIFYTVNVYTRWLPSRHTEAFFGFVFYLWLGAWCALRKDRVQSWAQARSPWWLAFWACVAAGVAMWEMTILKAHNSPDSMNTLRFSNQIYSVLIVILLVRIRRRTWPAFINVADTTYGIYLIHATVVTFVFHLAMKIVLVPGHTFSQLDVFFMWAILSPTVYFLTLQITRALASSQRFGWTVGASNFELPKVIVPAALTQPTEA